MASVIPATPPPAIQTSYCPFGAADRNWESFGDHVTVPDGVEQWRRNMLMDPQTSGGLLVSCPHGSADAVVGLFHDQGYGFATVIGKMTAGSPHVTVRCA